MLSCFHNTKKHIEDLKVELWKACLRNNSIRIYDLIAKGAPVNFNVPVNWCYKHPGFSRILPAGTFGDLPLLHMVAMIPCSYPCIEALLHHGADIHAMHEIQHDEFITGSILHNVLYMRDNIDERTVIIFEQLIRYGANVHAKNSKGQSVVDALMALRWNNWVWYIDIQTKDMKRAFDRTRYAILKLLLQHKYILTKDEKEKVNHLLKNLISHCNEEENEYKSQLIV